jgi:hypothetical protein
MATVVQPAPFHDRRTGERRRGYPAMLRGADGMRVSWGGIFGGVLVALGVLLLLAALGVAVGISTAQPGETDAAALGAGAGIWAAASLLLALFVGGVVSTRIGAIFDRATGLFEGVLVWVVAVLLIGALASSGIGMVAGGAFDMVRGAARTVGAMAGAGGGDMASGSAEQMLRRLNDPNTAATIAAATGMPEQEVRSALAQVSERVQAARDDPAKAAAAARQGMAELYEKARSSGAIEQKAQEVKPAATRAAWISFGALVISLLAAVLGAMAGRRRAHVMIP